MQINLKQMFGWTTIACIAAFLLRRLIPMAFHEDSMDFWHSVCGPWYVDLYVLSLEHLWPFEGSMTKAASFDKQYHDLYILTQVLSVVVWSAIHIALAIFTTFWITDTFFTSPPVQEEPVPYEQPEPGNHD